MFENVNLSSKREKDEDKKEYKNRLKRNKKRVKLHLAGTLFFMGRKGKTYRSGNKWKKVNRGKFHL